MLATIDRRTKPAAVRSDSAGSHSDRIPTVDPAEALDRKGAARLLSVSTRTIDDLARRREFPRLKLGRKTLFRRADLLAYLDRLAAVGAVK